VALINVIRPRLHWTWIASLLLLAALATSSILFADRQIVINTSPSVQPGLYLRSSTHPAVGQIVDFRIPPAARNYMETRTGRNGENWYILKPIVAGPGDRVDTTGKWLLINGRQIAPMPPINDTGGRSLPIWRDNRVLGADEFFVFSNRIPNSFDSRFYGPIRREQIAAVRKALVLW
jgi:conjugative transfer signal peptidase TraF